MSKIHKVSYGDYFSSNFDTTAIDGNLADLEIEEKLMLIDNIIDYLYVNFRGLGEITQKGVDSDDSNGEFGSEDEAEYTVAGGGVVAKKPLSKVEAMKQIQLNKKLVAEKALGKKLARKGIVPSMSLSFKKHQIQLAVDGQRVRKIKREEAKTMVKMNQRESTNNSNKV